MRSFAQNQEPSQKTNSASGIGRGQTFSLQRDTVSSSLCPRRTIGNRALQPLLQVNPAGNHLQENIAGDSVAASVVDEITRSRGQPLDQTTRAFMEARLGHDFSRVRLHTDEMAASSAHRVGAVAYTVGQH